MKRLLLWTLALIIAAAPALADVCRLDCAAERVPACPLHQTTPHKCTHDHRIAAADLTRNAVNAQRPIVAVVAFVVPDFRRPHESNDVAPLGQLHAPPPSRSRTDVLRI